MSEAEKLNRRNFIRKGGKVLLTATALTGTSMLSSKVGDLQVVEDVFHNIPENTEPNARLQLENLLDRKEAEALVYGSAGAMAAGAAIIPLTADAAKDRKIKGIDRRVFLQTTAVIGGVSAMVAGAEDGKATIAASIGRHLPRMNGDARVQITQDLQAIRDDSKSKRNALAGVAVAATGLAYIDAIEAERDKSISVQSR